MVSNSGLILVICIAVFLILVSKKIRVIAAIAVFIMVLIAAKNVFIHSKSCPRDGTECFVELQPTWSGPCTTSDRAGVIKVEGTYFLTAAAGTDAAASCVDIRFWQK